MEIDVLNRTINNTSGPNGSVFAFNFLTSAVNQLQNISDRLKVIITIRNELVNKYQIDIISNQLEHLNELIAEYGRNEKKPENPASLINKSNITP